MVVNNTAQSFDVRSKTPFQNPRRIARVSQHDLRSNSLMESNGEHSQMFYQTQRDHKNDSARSGLDKKDRLHQISVHDFVNGSFREQKTH